VAEISSEGGAQVENRTSAVKNAWIEGAYPPIGVKKNTPISRIVQPGSSEQRKSGGGSRELGSNGEALEGF
jgi:hypothetical protein